MDAKTLKALKGSIVKWGNIVTGHGEDRASDNCPLCALYIKKNCRGCPVMAKTGSPDCHRTPYYGFADAWYDEKWGLIGEGGGGYSVIEVLEYRTSIGPKSQAAAIKEYQFLVSLLPTKQLRQRYSDI